MEGTSDIRLYSDSYGETELNKNEKGNYVLTDLLYSKFISKPYNVLLYIKNAGDHNAYDVSINVINANANTKAIDVLKPNDLISFVLNIDEILNKNIVIVINYGNI